MKTFSGFPDKTQYVSLPSGFFQELLPDISDIGELKLTLHLLSTLYFKKGYPRFVTRGELEKNPALRESLRATGAAPEKVLRNSLELAAQRGSLLRVNCEREGRAEEIYFLNTPADRLALERWKTGALSIPGLKPGAAGDAPQTAARPDIFTLYEQNIGLLTPLIADELREAEKDYPPEWVYEAIKEAVSANKRSWRYISRILERWRNEGKDDGAHSRDTAPGHDPDKYIRGKYGHMVQR